MSLKTIAEFFKDIGNILKKAITARIVPFVIVVIVLFGVLLNRLFQLQIVNGESYTNSYALKTQREVTTPGTRGNIYDRNGILLAYSELAYSVVIEDCGYYDSQKIKNEKLNKIIATTIEIIEKHGDTVNYDFSIEVNEFGIYRYTVSDNALLRFLRDAYGKSSINKLTEAEKNATAFQTVRYFINLYQLGDYVYDKETLLKMIYIRYNLSANSYKRYISYTIAQNVSDETMAEILENSAELVGVGIKEESVRKYNYSEYIAHIIGYTGKINESELEELQAIDDSYTSTDVIGKAGIEAAYETTLSGKKGTTTMLVDSVGRVQEILSSVDAVAGQNIYLSIDIEYQKKVYNLLERRLAETLVINIVDSDDTTAGPGNQVVIPIWKVYFALINNNLIDMKQIETSETDSAKQVNSIFQSKREQILTEIETIISGNTPYSLLSEEMQSYVSRLRTLLINNGIINSEKISSSDELSKQWSNGSISIRDYIIGAINAEWINIYNLDVLSDYPSTDEALNAIIDEAMAEIRNDDEFNKLIYEDLISSHRISGKAVCMILMEQNAINYTESEYIAIKNGGSTYDFLIKKIGNLDITPAQLALDPCSGSCVVENPNTGEILSMVSYPSYDINYFSGTIDAEYYRKLLNDKSTPLVNRATQTKIAPGSTFKPLIAIAGLNEGVITAGEKLMCDGIFDLISPNIKCWCYPGEHGQLTTVQALSASCNDYFCQVGYRLSINPNGILDFDYGLSVIKKYADLLGLSTKSGIEIPETTPHPSDYNSVASSIGQGTNAYTSVNLARYVSTIANSGTVYNSTIINKIVTNDGTVIQSFEPSISNTVDINPSYWNIVHSGMESVIETSVLQNLYKNIPTTVCGKSGTAQENKSRGDHACYIIFSLDENNQPELAVASMIPYAYGATNAGIMTYYAMATYYGLDLPESVYFTYNAQVIINE